MLLFDKLFKRNSHKSESSGHKGQGGLSDDFLIPDQYIPFWDLQKSRQLLEIKIGSASRGYQSMVLAVDIERGLLWLDDLFPQQFMLDVGDYITLRHHRNNEQLVVRAPVVALGADYGAAGFAIELPEHAIYTSRRGSLRYAMGHEPPPSVKIRTLGQEPCYGTLQDISAGGLRLMVGGNLLSQLRHGALLPLCEVTVSDDLQIRCRARICAFKIGRNPYRHTQISLEFVDLPEEKRAALAQFLYESQFPASGQQDLTQLTGTTTLHSHTPTQTIGRFAAA